MYVHQTQLRRVQFTSIHIFQYDYIWSYSYCYLDSSLQYDNYLNSILITYYKIILISDNIILFYFVCLNLIYNWNINFFLRFFLSFLNFFCRWICEILFSFKIDDEQTRNERKWISSFRRKRLVLYYFIFSFSSWNLFHSFLWLSFPFFSSCFIFHSLIFFPSPLLFIFSLLYNSSPFFS